MKLRLGRKANNNGYQKVDALNYNGQLNINNIFMLVISIILILITIIYGLKKLIGLRKYVKKDIYFNELKKLLKENDTHIVNATSSYKEAEGVIRVGSFEELLDARKIVEKKIAELKNRVDKLEKKPKLVIIRIGDDFASGKYVANKIKRCSEVGIDSQIIHLKENITQLEVEKTILKLNEDKDITGILLQLPIPKHLDEDYLTNLIKDEKDVDGFTIANMGKLSLGLDGNIACTPRGIITLLKEFDIEIESKDVLIINRSNIVGKPLIQMFLKENATVTIAHSKTKNLKEKVKLSDIVVTAVGKINFLSADDFSDNTTIIDVSINFDEFGKMCGDISKDNYSILIKEKNCNITPVPNGVGQMTVIELIEQTIEIAEKKENIL